MQSKCGFSNRSCQIATSLSEEEEVKRLHLAWRFFDMALQQATSNNIKVHQVRDPGSFIVNAKQTAITMSDQIPVWLKAQTGKLLTSKRRLRTARIQRQVRHESKKFRKANLVELNEVKQQHGNCQKKLRKSS